MGLLMYRDPDDEQIVKETAARLDRVAATRRSAIRRESTVRSRDTPTAAQGLARLMRDRRRDSSRLPERADARLARLQAELESLGRMRPGAVETLERDWQRVQRGLDLPVTESLHDVDGQDSGAENMVEPADIIRAHLPQPPRESNLRFEISQSSNSRPSSPWRHQSQSRITIPSPPYSSGSSGRRDHSIPDGPLLDDNSMPALTEGFAPAHTTTSGSRHANTSAEDDAQLETPPPESWDFANYPALRRVSHMSPRPLPRVDGLGDGRRSPTPLSDTREEDTWATLLTEMHTDRSTPATSFGSTIPDSRVRNGRSSQNTSTSFGEIGSNDDTCDLDLPPGITEEDVLEARARHRPRDRDRMTGRRGLEEHQDRIAGRVEVSMFRAILERMHRRQEVPDDWWATVGLSPDFGRTLE